MQTTRTFAVFSVLIVVSGAAAHALFLASNWQYILAPESSPCFSAGTPFGDCEPPLSAIGLAFPLCAYLANAFLVVPISLLACSDSRGHSLISGFCVSTLTLAALAPLTLILPAVRELGATFLALHLGFISAALLGLVASLLLHGLPRLTGVTGILSAAGALYLLYFGLWLTFD